MLNNVKTITMKNKNQTIKINGKEYKVELKNDDILIDGKPLDEFVDSLDAISLLEISQLGRRVVMDIISGRKTADYEKIMDDYYKMKNN